MRNLKIAREGYPFIAIALLAALVLKLTGLVILPVLMLGAAAFIAYFFRDPERVVPQGEGLIVSPADGRILHIIRDVTNPYTNSVCTKVSIFMSVLNVHINRFPVEATVKKAIYNPGKFFVASLDKASEQNERNCLVLQDAKGREISMVQIAGLVARRIVCYAREGDRRARGERFGLIRFGSRVDLYLPPEAEILVGVGQNVVAGETIIGRCL